MSDNWLEQVYEERKQELFRFLYVILGETLYRNAAGKGMAVSDRTKYGV